MDGEKHFSSCIGRLLCIEPNVQSFSFKMLEVIGRLQVSLLKIAKDKGRESIP